MSSTSTAGPSPVHIFPSACLSAAPASVETPPDIPSLRSLRAVFRPKSVAVVGASERTGSVGRTVLANLLASPFGGCVYPVNSKRKSVLGVAAFPDITSVPEKVDLAVIVTPAPTLPAIIAQCGERGVPAAIVISAGFKELGPEGAQLEAEILVTARANGIRIVGPNCLGVMSPLSGLNATFAHGMARRGKIAFLSQSGALCTAILDWSLKAKVGFSAFVSLGSMLDVGWGDLIDYFGRDPETESILLYMETVGNARAFLSAARGVALTKPIIVIKGGRTDEASKAAASHTGSLAGSDMAFDAAVERVGLLRVERIAEVFSVADMLAKQPRPKGKRLTIITNAGGPGVLATDTLVQGGGKLAELGPATREKLDEFLPVHWSHNNPIDVLGDADAARYARTLELAAADPDSDGLLVVLTPQDMTDPLATAEALRPLTRLHNKPVIASWMGGDSVAAAVEVLNDASIPNFHYPDTAARAFNYLWRYAEHQRNIYETPALLSDDDERATQRIAAAGAILDSVRKAGRTILTEEESKRVLAAYDIPTVPITVATSEKEAVEAARQMGFPVALKLHSLTITHKSDVGGVQLNLDSPEQVARAFHKVQGTVSQRCGAEHFQGVTIQPMIRKQGYELIVGSTLDAQFGPVIMFGAGGELVEVFRDSAVTLPPLNATLARRLMRRTKIHRALLGVRGRQPVNLPQLEQTLLRFSNLVMEQPWIRECDINPLLASPEGVTALDARIVLCDPATPECDLVRPAIRPYPARYLEKVTLTDGTPVTIRPIRLEDEPLLVKFHETLSDESVRRRYFHAMHVDSRTEHQRLIQVCYNDYDREIALVAVAKPAGETPQLLGVARLSREYTSHEAEFAVLVSDAWQGRGLGKLLLSQLITVGQEEGVRRIVGHVIPDNWPMQLLCQNLGFHLEHDAREDETRATLEIRPDK